MLEIFSPEQELQNSLFVRKGVRVFVKRDDMIHPFISGNKWRKLKYIIDKADKEGKKHLVTFGGVWSNHLLATACACAQAGFKATGIVRGEDINTDTLLLCRLFGMKLIFTDRTSYRDKQELFKTICSDDPYAMFVDEGGNSPEAAKGCAELINELNIHYNHLVCAAGTGATASGLLKGIVDNGLTTCLHVIPVLKGADFISHTIKGYVPCTDNLYLHKDYHFGGYAKTETVLLSFIASFAAQTGILLDPVYTGKMMYGLFDMIDTGVFKEGDSVLALHTGGLFGLLGMKERLSDVLKCARLSL